MMNRFHYISGLLLMLLSACSHSDEPGPGPTPEIATDPDFPSQELGSVMPTPEIEEVVSGQYEGAIKLLAAMSDEASGKNLLISPFCFNTVMAMVANAATGNTQKELLEILGVDNLNTVNTANADLVQAIPVLDKNVTFELANAIWTDHALHVRPEYTTLLREAYISVPHVVDYAADNVKDIINSWVDQRTHGMIPTLYDDIVPSGPVTLVNALYLKGVWDSPFDPEKTDISVFHTSNGDVDVKMMHQADMSAEYVTYPDAEVITLPFGGKWSYLMTLILPSADTDIDSFIASLDGQRLREMCKSGVRIKAEVSIPKFTLDTGVDLAEILRKMGYTHIFTPSLWKGLTNDDIPLYINNVVHKTRFSIAESGVEAAAAGGTGMVASPGPLDKVSFTADRPFVLLFTESGCNTPIFLGVVRNPK